MSTILISIKPEHADNILSGRKTVELRKSGFPKCDFIIMYATAPTKGLVGMFSVPDVTTMSKETLWLMYGRETCISKELFDEYYKGHHWATAIRVGTVVVSKSVLNPNKFTRFHAPMSWMYIAENVAYEMFKAMVQDDNEPRYEPCCPVCKKPLVSELHLDTAEERIDHCLECIRKSKTEITKS